MSGNGGVGGHKALPHTADLQIEAWSRTLEGCIAQAVRGMVESFADTSQAREITERTCSIRADTLADLLVAVLGEVVYHVEVDGELPLGATVEDVRSGADGTLAKVRFPMAEVASTTQVGAVPKAVSLHGLSLTGPAGGWRCRVTLDV